MASVAATPAVSVAEGDPPGARDGRGVLKWIAVFKFAKTATLLVVAAAAFGLLGDRLRASALARLTDLATRLAASTEFHGLRGAFGHVAERALDGLLRWLGDATPTRLEVTGAIALAYAAVLGTEGVGLWLAKPWAELFSVGVTASLIPFEVWEIARQATAVKVGVLVVNVAVVVYLAQRVRRERAARRAAAGAAAVAG